MNDSLYPNPINKFVKIQYSADGYEISYIIIGQITALTTGYYKITMFKVDIVNVIEDNDTVLESAQRTNEGSVVYAFDIYQPITGYKIEFLEKEDYPEHFI